MQKILEKFPKLTADDVRSTSSGSTGEDVLLSQAAKDSFPFAVECKNHQAFSVYKHYEQARSHVRGHEMPLLIIKQNRAKPLVCISLDDFMDIISGNQKSNKNQ